MAIVPNRIYKGRMMTRSPYYVTVNSVASATITCASVLAADTVTIDSVVYTAVSGAKADNTQFSIDTGDTECAADLADSIANDTRTGPLAFTDDFIADSDLGVVNVSTLTVGVAGDSLTFVSSNGTRLAVTGGGTMTGGSEYVTSASIDLYVWQGSSASRPATPTRTIAKTALTATSTDIVFEIASLSRDLYIHTPDPSSTSELGGFVAWVEIEVTAVQTTTTPATINYNYLAFDGYTYFEDDTSNPGKILAPAAQSSHLIVRADSGANQIKTGFFVNDVDGFDRIRFLDGVTVEQTQSFTAEASSLFSYDKWRYSGYTDSSNIIDSIAFYEGLTTLVDTFTVAYNDKCKGVVWELDFVNKEGMMQRLSFFGKQERNLKVSRSSYNGIITEVTNGNYTFNTDLAQFKTYNVNGTETLVLNSGWVLESMNESFKQLLLSEHIWSRELFTAWEAVKIETSSLKYKTKNNDKLINYTLNLSFAKNVINSV